MERIRRLENPIQHYAWGSRTALAELQGRSSPTARPEAELWIGAHPQAASRIQDADGWRSLRSWIARDPARVLGPEVASRFGGELPFLLKVLAVEQPLSLQAHPDARQAREGFEREERAGIPRDGEHRCYRDPRHKPELICALTPFRALKGFRSPGAIAAAFELGVASLPPEWAAFRQRPNAAGWERLLRALMSMTSEARRRLLAEAVAAARADTHGDPALACLLRLAGAHPDDVGALAPLFLNLVELEPGEALFLPARELHCHLDGVAVEVMASSDNVLRGGLTRKHVDLDELLRVVHFAEADALPVATERVSPVEVAYRAPAEEFRLSVVSSKPGASFRTEAGASVEVLLCTAGEVVVADPAAEELRLRPGESLLVPAGSGGYGIAGEGTVFRVCVPPRGAAASLS